LAKKTKTSEDTEHDLAAQLKAIPVGSGRYLAKKGGVGGGELFRKKARKICRIAWMWWAKLR
jgi:hypothetical protein